MHVLFLASFCGNEIRKKIKAISETIMRSIIGKCKRTLITCFLLFKLSVWNFIFLYALCRTQKHKNNKRILVGTHYAFSAAFKKHSKMLAY